MDRLSLVKAKIKNLDTLKAEREKWREENKTVVFTNGCFDLIHYGHIHYLAQARDLGEILIIGVNADLSVKRLKGPHRPIKDEQTRLHLLASLAFVDAVVLFEQETPKVLIETIIPDILVKGGDYKVDDIVGADVVLENGGDVKTLSFIDGHSTTALEAKIKKS